MGGHNNKDLGGGLEGRRGTGLGQKGDWPGGEKLSEAKRRDEKSPAH